MSVGHLYVFFGKMSIQVLCPFCNMGLFVFLLLSDPKRLEFLACRDELSHWECRECYWDLGPLGESLNSRYWVGSTSFLKRGQKVLMTVDGAHHTIPDLAFGLKIHLHLQRFCKTLDKLTYILGVWWGWSVFPFPPLFLFCPVRWVLNWEVTAGIAGTAIHLRSFNEDYLIIRGN